MSQYARPDSDVSATNFAGFTATTPGSFYTNIDESSANDSDYVYTIGTSASYECGLSDVSDPGVHTGHTFRFRVALSGPLGGGEDPLDYTVSLYQGATLIASSVGTIAVATVTAVSATLSSGEAGSITDYTDLRLRFEVPSATSPAVRFTWAELEVPDAPSADVVDIDCVDIILEPDDLTGIPGETVVDIDGVDVVLEPADVGAGTIVDIGGVDIELEAADAGAEPGPVVVPIDGVDVVLDVASVDPSYLIVDIDGVDIRVETDIIDRPDDTDPGDDGPPTGPVVPEDETQRFLVLPKVVRVVMPAESGYACPSLNGPETYARAAGFLFHLAYFDHTKTDGFREGWGPSNIRLGINLPYGGFVDPDAGPPLYPYWATYYDDGDKEWQPNAHATAVASSFLVFAPGYIYGQVAQSPTDAEINLENYGEANQLAMHVGRDYYGWRVAGGDDKYDGIVAYPIDAHDDTLIFTYRDGEASVRVTPTPHLGNQGATQFQASEYNCEREIVRYYSDPPCTRSAGDRTRTNWPWEERPVYADGTMGEVCRRSKDCTEEVTSCPDSTLCVRVGESVDPFTGQVWKPRSGVPVDILDETGATVTTGTTDAAGYACFTLPGGNYYVRLRCSNPPGYGQVYECGHPYVLPPCGKSLTVNLGFCRVYRCVTAIDFDTGGGINGLYVGEDLDIDSIECDTTTTSVYTGRDGSGRACIWGGTGGGSAYDPDGYFDPPIDSGYCNSDYIHLGNYIRPPDGWSGDCSPACCDTSESIRVFYNRTRWTRLIRWCGPNPDCHTADRHPAMVPRLLYTTINAPGPIWNNLNGVRINLNYVGSKYVSNGIDLYCKQVWDSGCLPGAGNYSCGQYVYTSSSRTYLGEVSQITYAASRVWLVVDTTPSTGNICGVTTSLVVRNFITTADCESADPFAQGGTGNDARYPHVDDFGGPNPYCGPCYNDWWNHGDGFIDYCAGLYGPAAGNPNCGWPYYSNYPMGFSTACFGHNLIGGACEIMTGHRCRTTGPTASGCPRGCNALSGPVNFSGTYRSCGNFPDECRWEATYDIFE